jgi:DNA-directed RNA polymerase subunit M/transcription elongation factor TFIIS
MENQFCDNCNNSMYIYLDKEQSKLHLYCKSCNNKVDYNEKLIYDQNFTLDLADSINSTKFINYDLTLPPIQNKNIKCPNNQCISITENKLSDIIYIKYDKENLLYLYSCNYCSQKWTNK